MPSFFAESDRSIVHCCQTHCRYCDPTHSQIETRSAKRPLHSSFISSSSSESSFATAIASSTAVTMSSEIGVGEITEDMDGFVWTDIGHCLDRSDQQALSACFEVTMAETCGQAPSIPQLPDAITAS